MLQGNQKSFMNNGQYDKNAIEEAFGNASSNSSYKWPAEDIYPAGFAGEAFRMSNGEQVSDGMKPFWKSVSNPNGFAMGTGDTSGLFSLVMDTNNRPIRRITNLPAGKTQAQLYFMCQCLKFNGYAMSATGRPTPVYTFVPKAQAQQMQTQAQDAQIVETGNNMPF